MKLNWLELQYWKNRIQQKALGDELFILKHKHEAIKLKMYKN